MSIFGLNVCVCVCVCVCASVCVYSSSKFNFRILRTHTHTVAHTRARAALCPACPALRAIDCPSVRRDTERVLKLPAKVLNLRVLKC